MRTLPHIHDVIGQIVADMRETATVTASNEASTGVYNLTVDNTLVDNDFITIESIEYKVYNVTSTQITIEGSGGLDFTGKTIAANAPYYMHEKIPKANEILTQKTGKNKWQKYPLVLLLHPYTVDRTITNYATVDGLVIAILNNTESEWNSDKRYSDNFDIDLEPIYNNLIEGIYKATEFNYKDDNVVHERVDSLYLDGNPLPDKLDAITVTINDIQVLYDTVCEPSTQVIKRPLTIESEGDGVTSPAIGTYQIENGETQQLLAAENSGSEFVEWIINTVSYPNRVVNLLMDGAKSAKAYFRILIDSRIKQWLLKEDPIFENNELKDYSNIPVNANVYTRYVNITAASTLLTLINNIIIDYSTNGIKHEFVVSLESGATSSILIREIGDAQQGVRFQFDGIRIGFNTSSGYQFAMFSSFIVSNDGVPIRFKTEVIGTTLHGYLTTYDDEDYLNATHDTIDLTTITGLLPSEVYRFGNGTYATKSKFIGARLNDIKFNFELGEKGFHIGAINSSEHGYQINVPAQAGYWQDYILQSTKGSYTLFYFYNGELKIVHVPKVDGEDSINNTIGYLNYIKDNNGIDIGTITYEDNETTLNNSWGFKLDASMEQYDQDNTYFDVASDANVITENIQPTKLNSRVFYDRANNSDIRIYNDDVDIVSSFNTINKKWLNVGDSTANEYFFPIILQYKTSLITTSNYYGGKTTAEILTLLQADVTTTPTLVNDKDLITHISGANDYAANVSAAQFEIDLDATIQYLRTENITAPIILIGMYNFGNPIDDGTTPNAAGLTMNIIRQVVASKATEYNLHYCNWNDANILQADLSDTVHAYTASGALKCANQVLETLNTITE